MDQMGLISDYDIRIVDCGFIGKFLCSTLSEKVKALNHLISSNAT